MVHYRFNTLKYYIVLWLIRFMNSLKSLKNSVNYHVRYLHHCLHDTTHRRSVPLIQQCQVDHTFLLFLHISFPFDPIDLILSIHRCSVWLQGGFCGSNFYTTLQKQFYCGTQCGLC